jgi:DNA-binding transcriptional ArsR family regulator
MSDVAVLEALADALDAASGALRQHLALLGPPAARGADGQAPQGAVAKARAIHERLGSRQAQILEVLEEAGGDGTNTGVISKAIGQDQPNVYLTLRSLAGLGFVEKDKTTDPHTYRLSPGLRD